MKPENAADMRTLRRCWLTEMQFSKGEARIVFSRDFAAIAAAAVVDFSLGVSRFVKTFISCKCYLRQRKKCLFVTFNPKV